MVARATIDLGSRSVMPNSWHGVQGFDREKLLNFMKERSCHFMLYPPTFHEDFCFLSSLFTGAHRSLLGTIGNLSLMYGADNTSLGKKSFEEKRQTWRPEHGPLQSYGKSTRLRQPQEVYGNDSKLESFHPSTCVGRTCSMLG
jgi:hypothetical protein